MPLCTNRRKHRASVWKPLAAVGRSGGFDGVEMERLRIVLQGEADDFAFAQRHASGVEGLADTEVVEVAGVHGRGSREGGGVCQYRPIS